MKTRSFFPMIAVVLAIVAALLSGPWRGDPVSHEVTVVVDEPSSSSIHELVDTDAERERASFESEFNYGRVSGEVVWSDDGTPAMGVRLGIIPREGPPYAFQHYKVTGVRGAVSFADCPVGELIVFSDAGHVQHLQVEEGEEARFRFSTETDPTVLVLVTDAVGVPVSQAEVWGRAIALGGHERLLGHTDASGKHIVRLASRFASVQVRSAGYEPSSWYGYRLRTVHLELDPIVIRRPDCAITGLVRLRNGAPAKGAHLSAQLSSAREVSSGNVAPAVVRERVGADGHFTLRVGAGDILLAAKADRSAIWQEYIHLAPSAIHTVEITLGDEPSVRGAVTDEAGKAVVGALVNGPLHWAFGAASTTSSEEGAYELPLAQTGVLQLFAHHTHAGRDDWVGAVEAGHEYAWDPILRRGSVLSGQLMDHRDEPLAGWYVQAKSGAHGGWRGRARTEVDGTWEVTQCIGEVFTVMALEPRGALPRAWIEGVRSGTGGLVLRVEEGDGAQAMGSVFDATGAPLAGAEMLASNLLLGFSTTARTTDEGEFVLAPMCGGRHALYCRRGAGKAAFLGHVDIAATGSTNLGRLYYPQESTVRVVVALDEGLARPERWDVQLWGGLGPPPHPEAQSDGVWLFQSIVPGRYELRVQADGIATMHSPIEVGPAVQIDMNLRASRGFPTRLEVKDEENKYVSDNVEIVLNRAGQPIVATAVGTPGGPHGCGVSLNCQAGHYTATAFVDGEPVGTEAFYVGSGPEKTTIELVLH